MKTMTIRCLFDPPPPRWPSIAAALLALSAFAVMSPAQAQPPDSRRIAFTPRGADPGLAFQFHQPCAPVRVVDAGGGVHELGVAAAAPQELLQAGGAPVTVCSFMQWIP